jgi:sugar lactone lactonase YvrE
VELHEAAYTQTPRSTKWFARPLLLGLALFIAAVALAPATSSARTTRPYEDSFGSFPSRFEGGPTALAVDQANGDVYVRHATDVAHGVISRFTATGAPDNFTAGPDGGTNSLTGFRSEGTIAVDRAAGALNGDILVVEDVASSTENGTVKIYANDGSLAGTLDGSGTSDGVFTNPCGVAVDQANGDIYVSQGALRSGDIDKIWRYSPKSPAAPFDDSDFTVTGITSDHACDIAADSGNVYVAVNTDAGSGELRKYSAAEFVANPSSSSAGTLIDKGPVTAVYVDPKNGDVYANEGNRVAVYGSSGTRLYDFGAAAYFGTNSQGIAVKSAASGVAAKAYVTDPQPGGKEIDVFGLPTNVQVLTHPQVASFGTDSSSESAFSTNLDQLGFEQANRKLFALDGGVPGIYGFDASDPSAYSALAGFAPLGAAGVGVLPGLAVDNSGLASAGNVYLASGQTNLLYGFDPTGAPLGGAFPVDPAVTPGGPEGSPKELCGAAVDSAGNIWVSNLRSKRILKYSSAGASLPGSIDTSAQGTEGKGACRLTFDSDDNLYAEVYGVVWRYSAASGYSEATLVDGSGGRSVFSTLGITAATGGIAVDPSNDHLYVAHYRARQFPGGPVVAFSGWVDEFDAAGNFVDEFATGFSESRFSGITVDATNHYVYLSDPLNGKIRVLRPGAVLPEVAVSSASGATNTTATLNGSVGTQELALTDCHFEYVSEAAFRVSGFKDLGSGGSAPCSPAFGTIPLDFSTHPVSAAIGGLSTSTAYRFRLVASNVNGTLESSDAEFTTPGKPVVETVGAPTRTTTTAQLGGRVDPRNAPATYYFEYGTQGPCDANPCAATSPQPAGSGDVMELVSEEIEGLEPNTTYHYRVVADNVNPDGPALGADMTVTTRASEAPLSHGHFPGPPGSDRAYEQVTQPDTGGNPVNLAAAFSDDGNRALYYISGGTSLAEEGNAWSVYFSQRAETGSHEGAWQQKSILPPRSNEIGNPHWFVSADAGLTAVPGMFKNESSKTSAVWRLDPAASASKLAEGSLEAGTEIGLGGAGVSEDGSRLMAFLHGNHDPEYPSASYNLYDLTSGTARLVSFLPGTTSACGVIVKDIETPFAVWRHTISADGSLAFFESGCSGPIRVYLRDLVAGQSKLVSTAPISGPECDANFISSTPDAVFLESKSRLSAEDTTPSSCADNGLDGDVYRYDLGDGALKCVTCVADVDVDMYVPFNFGLWRTDPSVLVSEDGSRIYFQSPRALVPGAPTVQGGGSVYRVDVNSGDLAWVGGPNLALASGQTEPGVGTVATPDGATVLFMSRVPFLNPLNGPTNAGTNQLYRYDDRDRSLTCVSCPGDGSAPRGAIPAMLRGVNEGITQLSDDGKTIAFATPTPLVGADQNTSGPGGSAENGVDVYEWRDGRHLLITDGLSNATPGTEGPAIGGISPSGRDIFFVAPRQYTPDALDGYRRLYDARIGGGFNYPVPPPPCPLEVCQGTPKGAPEERAPGSGTFAGPGNLKQRHVKHKKHKAKKRHHKKAKKHAKHRANDNRGTAR